jgi:hypothetical protein
MNCVKAKGCRRLEAKRGLAWHNRMLPQAINLFPTTGLPVCWFKHHIHSSLRLQSDERCDRPYLKWKHHLRHSLTQPEYVSRLLWLHVVKVKILFQPGFSAGNFCNSGSAYLKLTIYMSLFLGTLPFCHETDDR